MSQFHFPRYAKLLHSLGLTMTMMMAAREPDQHNLLVAPSTLP